MKGDELFIEHYHPGLVAADVGNVVLRIYQHIVGLASDDPNRSTRVIYSPRDEVEDRLTLISDLFGEEYGVAITSTVSNGVLQRNLLLLDCSLPVSDENEQDLRMSIRSMQRHLPGLAPGMLLRTIHSYHLVGFNPLTLEDWQAQMAKSILVRTVNGQPIVDVRYVGHSLERGYGSLRINDYQDKPTPDYICDI